MHNLTLQLPETGFVRLSTILQLIPVSRSTWWAGVKSGRFPKPVKLGPKTTAWEVSAIRDLLKSYSSAQKSTSHDMEELKVLLGKSARGGV